MASHVTGPFLNRDNNVGNRAWQSNSPLHPDPDYAIYWNDFLVEQDYAAADWVVTTTEAGGGDATEALTANDLTGSLLITNDAADNDLDALQHTQETWKMASGKRLWYETKVKFADVDDMDTFIGLAITDTTVLDTADRIGFQWTDASAGIDVLSEKSSTETLTSSGKDAVDATYVKLGMYWDGQDSVKFYVDRKQVANHTTNNPDDVNLCVTMHLQNGSANANTLTCDYIYVVMER